MEISVKNYRILPGPRGKKILHQQKSDQHNQNIGNRATATQPCRLDHLFREEWDLATHFKTIWVPNHAKHCETLRNIAILNPILDLTTRFLLPLEAGWGAVPLVGETCDQPGGISNRVVME